MNRDWFKGGARLTAACLSTTALCLLATTAVAQPGPDPDCPPGAYCQREDVGPPADAPARDEGKPGVVAEDPDGESVRVIRGDRGAATVELPPVDRGGDPSAPRTFTYVPPSNGRPGQVIVYEDGSAAPRVPPGDIAPAPTSASVDELPTTVRERHRRWGLMARVNGALLPQYRDDIEDFGMVGVGVSLRYRPVPAFALDFGADFMGGRDSNGYDRRELPVHASAMFYPNPDDFAQFYAYGGVNGALAYVETDEFQNHLAEGTSDTYSYVGVHGGAGVELRLTDTIGIAVDAQMYIRTRTDDDGTGRFAEFVEPVSGERSNTSAGGLARAGVNFWW